MPIVDLCWRYQWVISRVWKQAIYGRGDPGIRDAGIGGKSRPFSEDIAGIQGAIRDDQSDARLINVAARRTDGVVTSLHVLPADAGLGRGVGRGSTIRIGSCPLSVPGTFGLSGT